LLVVFIDAKVVGSITADGGELVVTLVVVIVVLAVLLIVVRDGGKNFDFTTENHGEALSANGFLDKREIGAAPPFIEFTTKSVGFGFQTAEFARSEKSMTTRGVDVSDRRIDDGGLGRASNL